MYSNAYSISDLIFLFLEQKRSDFIIMLFHHTCTLSLTMFSYYTHNFAIGAVVLVLHNSADVIVYLVRIVLYLRVPIVVKDIVGLSTLFAFIYFRLFCLCKCIYSIYTYSNFKWDITHIILYAFLNFLVCAHVYWIYIVSCKVFDAIFNKKLSDTFQFRGKLNKQSKEN